MIFSAKVFDRSVSQNQLAFPKLRIAEELLNHDI